MKKLLLGIIVTSVLVSLFTIIAAFESVFWLLIPSFFFGVILISLWVSAEKKYNDVVSKKLTDDKAKLLATNFFYSWYNAKGSNTEQGFDDWWEKNKKKYIKEQNIKNRLNSHDEKNYTYY